MGAVFRRSSPARDTTGHDGYAASRTPAADLLIVAGFGRDPPVEDRGTSGAEETVSRYGLTATLETRGARENILTAPRGVPGRGRAARASC